MGYCVIYNKSGRTFDGYEFSYDCPVAFPSGTKAFETAQKLKDRYQLIIGHYSEYENQPFKVTV